MARKQSKGGARVTVRDIAEATNFSIGTVSTVLNQRHVERRIPVETAELVRETAARLGYLPDIGARRLRSGAGARNNIVIAFITSFEAPLGVVNQFVSALRKAAVGETGGRRRSFSLLIEMFPAGRLRELPGLLSGDHFNAALIANTTPEDDLFLARTHLPYPVVLVNRSVPRYASVVEDPEGGARAAEILVRAKRSHLAVLHGRPLTQTTRARVDSFMAASVQLLGRPAHVVVADSLSESAAYEAMEGFFAAGGRCDGLYAVTDSLALGAYHAIRRRKWVIPDDIAVVGVGDYESSPFFDPPLTSVGVLRQQVGWEASQMLLRMLGQTGGAQPERIETPVHTVLRESTGHGQR